MNKKKTIKDFSNASVMDSFIQTPTFQYNPNAVAESDSEFSGVLEIHVHHARNIHNICIYDNQDVYAKFSLTYNPDEIISTRIIRGGGKNPDFEEDLVINVRHSDAVLKCEIWMLSRAKSYMEDQLLGFALVPLVSVSGKGKITRDFDLSSTDLFHSPAGTVKLTLSLNMSANPSSDPVADSSITSELVLLDREASDGCLDLADYSRVEFPDVTAFKENQKMISEYFSQAELIGECCSFLHLGAMHRPLDDCERAANSSDEQHLHINPASPTGSIQNSGFLSSAMTGLSDDPNSVNSTEKNDQMGAGLLNSPNASVSMESDQSPPASPKKERDGQEEKPNCSGKMNLDAEQLAMQQQIVEMYMKSMQQFTESLAKTKLPMDLDIAAGNDQPDLDNNKKASSRVFYGSRAFF